MGRWKEWAFWLWWQDSKTVNEFSRLACIWSCILRIENIRQYQFMSYHIICVFGIRTSFHVGLSELTCQSQPHGSHRYGAHRRNKSTNSGSVHGDVFLFVSEVNLQWITYSYLPRRNRLRDLEKGEKLKAETCLKGRATHNNSWFCYVWASCIHASNVASSGIGGKLSRIFEPTSSRMECCDLGGNLSKYSRMMWWYRLLKICEPQCPPSKRSWKMSPKIFRQIFWLKASGSYMPVFASRRAVLEA